VGIKRRACATSVAVVVVCGECLPAWVVLRRCVRVSTAGSSQSLRAVVGCREQEGNTGTRNGAGEPRAACLRRVSPRRTGRSGWYLFETRSDGGIASLAYRRAGTSWDELGQAIGCLCEDGYTVLLSVRGNVCVVGRQMAGKRMERCYTQHDLW
jgi:hypothetical protein